MTIREELAKIRAVREEMLVCLEEEPCGATAMQTAVAYNNLLSCDFCLQAKLDQAGGGGDER